MNRLQRLLVLGLVAACATSATAFYGDSTNLISNGGFESGLTGWRPDKQHQLIDESGVARSGRSCLLGEVAKPDQALRLHRTVQVQAGNRYDFQIWAKGTNRTKLVLWAILPSSKQRVMVASWPKLSPRWQVYRTPVSVTESGDLTLEVIAPSSHNAPPGRIWIDDIALNETEMPPVVRISESKGFSDEPAMAMASDGTIYTVFNQFQNGADSLQIVRHEYNAGEPKPLGRWEVVGGKGTFILGPGAVTAGDRVAITYAAEEEGNWDVYLVYCGPHGPEKPIPITRETAVDVDPYAAWHDGTLSVVWESNRNGCRRILFASVRDRQVTDAVRLSDAGVSSYDPSVAVLSNGAVGVAWHSFRENNYDVYFRRRTSPGEWEDQRRLTRAPTIDRHAVLLGRGDEFWTVYENAQTERYHVSRTNRRRLVVAQVAAQGLVAPLTKGPSPLAARCEGGCASFDTEGRLWIAMLRPRLPRAGWDVFLTGLIDGQWLKPIPISGSKGMDRPPGLAIRKDAAIVAFQADNTPQSWSDLDKMADSTSDIYMAPVNIQTVQGSGEVQLTALVESKEVFEPAAIRLQRGEDSPTPSITHQGRQLNLYYGDLHEHSDVSVCNRVGDQSLDESYQHLRDLARHDFVCITDHGYNLNPYLWNYSAKLARVNDDPDRFLTFLGQEWTSTFEETSHEHPHGFYGHRNLILADLYFPSWWNARNRQTPFQVWEDLRRMNANFVHIPHQLADNGNVPTDWKFHDEVAQPVAEIFQTRGSYEYEGAPRQAKNTVPGSRSFLQDAWARDLVIGVIASPDHGGGYGKACVYAEELTRESILDALRARRCYGTTAAKIFLDVRVNGHLMGEKLAAPPGDAVKIDVVVRCPGPIDKIELCRSNRFIDATRPTGKRAQVTFVDKKPLDGRSYYYVRVTQQDEEIAWTSPVWFGVDASHDH